MGYLDSYSDEEVNTLLRRAGRGRLTSKDVETMSDTEVGNFLVEKALKVRVAEPGLSGSLRGLPEEELRGFEEYSSQDLKTLFERRRNRFIGKVWNTGKVSGISDEEIIQKVLRYYTRHGYLKDAAMRDINRRLTELQGEGKLY